MAVYTIQIPEGSPEKTSDVIKKVIENYIREYCSRTDDGYMIRTGRSFKYEIFPDRVEIHTTFEKEDTPETFRSYLLMKIEDAIRNVEKEYVRQRQSSGLSFLCMLVPAIIGFICMVLGIVLLIVMKDRLLGFYLTGLMTVSLFFAIYTGIAAALVAVEMSYLIAGPRQAKDKKISKPGLIIRIICLALLAAISVFLLITGKSLFLAVCIPLLIGTLWGLAGGIASLIRVNGGHFLPFPSTSIYGGAALISAVLFIAVLLLMSDINGTYSDLLTKEWERRQFVLEDMSVTEFAGRHSSAPGGGAPELLCQTSEAVVLMLKKYGADADTDSPLAWTARRAEYFKLINDPDLKNIMNASWKSRLVFMLGAELPDEADARSYSYPPYEDLSFEEIKELYAVAADEAYATLLTDTDLEARISYFNYILGRAALYYADGYKEGIDSRSVGSITMEEVNADWWNDPDSRIKTALSCAAAFSNSTESYFGTYNYNTLINARIMNVGLTSISNVWYNFEDAETPWEYDKISSLIVYDQNGNRIYVPINNITSIDMEEYNMIDYGIRRDSKPVRLTADIREKIITLMEDANLHSLPSDGLHYSYKNDPDELPFHTVNVKEGEEVIVLINPDWTVEVHRIAEIADAVEKEKASDFINAVTQIVNDLVKANEK